MKRWFGMIALGSVLFLASAYAQAGCGINLGVKNTGSSSITLYNYIKSSAKIKNGTWRDLHHGLWGSGTKKKWTLAAGETYTDNYSASFGCGKNRRYRIYYWCSNNTNRTTYYPSANGFTKKQSLTINLGAC